MANQNTYKDTENKAGYNKTRSAAYIVNVLQEYYLSGDCLRIKNLSKRVE